MGNPIHSLNEKIKGEPEYVLKFLLIAVAIIALLTAFFAPPLAKAAVLVWMVLP